MLKDGKRCKYPLLNFDTDCILTTFEHRRKNTNEKRLKEKQKASQKKQLRKKDFF